MIVLDSDILSLMLLGGSQLGTLKARLSDAGNAALSTTIVNYEEQVRGWLKRLAAAKKVSEQVEAYRLLNLHLSLYRNVKVLEFDETAAVHFQQLRKQFRRHGPSDLKIASIALANHATVITRNLRDFEPIPGLKVEDWTKA
jgi:tRNA(fMet)-specific endonuclease VapC